uniref:Leucine-rich repeat-containing N-terminal plant-type domain-containing protein n=2 Tax=Davidia involucrata TaxID=16924 RepID=A0A5B7AE14_DAVIN
MLPHPTYQLLHSMLYEREKVVSFRKREMGLIFFITAILLAVSSSVNCCPASDRAALLTIKSTLHEPYLGIFNSWRGTDCCHNWYGVSCDPMTRRVADISLRGESEDPIFQKAGRTGFMNGSISPAICKLNWLSSLTIADWKGISGTIPPCIASLPFLRILDLIGNKISGEIPPDIGRLSRLTVLNVADNDISGTIPRSITNLSSLMHLDLRNNRISGTLPRNFGNLRMLSRALLSRNRLTGSIPKSVSSIYRLSDLDLSFNRILGPLPDTLGKMPVLATLNLDGNRISGLIPPTLINSGVSILNLSRNAFEGDIPDVFGPRSYFTAIDLSYNRLRGPIPKSILSATYIGHLDLCHNHLCGPIPVGSPFDHLEASSFVFNDCLCGKPLRAC